MFFPYYSKNNNDMSIQGMQGKKKFQYQQKPLMVKKQKHFYLRRIYDRTSKCDIVPLRKSILVLRFVLSV